MHQKYQYCTGQSLPTIGGPPKALITDHLQICFYDRTLHEELLPIFWSCSIPPSALAQAPQLGWSAFFGSNTINWFPSEAFAAALTCSCCWLLLAHFTRHTSSLPLPHGQKWPPKHLLLHSRHLAFSVSFSDGLRLHYIDLFLYWFLCSFPTGPLSVLFSALAWSLKQEENRYSKSTC